MKIKMLKTAAGPAGTWSGTVTYRVPDDMPRDQADNFVARKVAVWLEAPPVEMAIAEEPRAENTDARPKRKRGRPPKKKELTDAD